MASIPEYEPSPDRSILPTDAGNQVRQTRPLFKAIMSRHRPYGSNLARARRSPTFFSAAPYCRARLIRRAMTIV